MLRHNVTTSILRFYESDEPSDFEEYCAVCSVIWESDDTIWLQGFHGQVTRKHLRKLLKFFVDNKIKTVKAYRAPKHLLPLSKQVQDHFEINVKELIDRFMKG